MSTPFFFETTSVTELISRGLARRSEAFSAEAADRLRRQPMVLVVDDERVIADTLVLILNSKGFRATAAYNGESALELARMAAPDILLTDVMMPGMNGVQLAITVSRACPDCRILLFSGNAATEELLKSARERGHEFEFLTKPVYPEALLQRLSAGRMSDEAA